MPTTNAGDALLLLILPFAFALTFTFSLAIAALLRASINSSESQRGQRGKTNSAKRPHRLAAVGRRRKLPCRFVEQGLERGHARIGEIRFDHWLRYRRKP